MTMTDPKQDVRQQFEAASDAYDLIDRYLRNNMGDADYADYSEALDKCYQAALQSPAVRELVEKSERVAHHLECAVEYIEKVYPNAKQLDRGPILSNMRRWSGKLRTALRTLGAGHVE